jgi:mannonate dehydratase
VVLAAWEGLDGAKVWDCHAHLVGTGDGGSGAWVNPRMHSLFHPLQSAQRLFYLNAACVENAPGRVDPSFVERLQTLVQGMRPGHKVLLLAFDRHHDETGGVVDQRTTFYTPNAYARAVAAAHPRAFEWVASVHPYRADALDALRVAAAHGALAIKWLPVAMGIDPASPRCDRFYAEMARLDLPLITHAGAEMAVLGGDHQDYGNPLKLRRALDHRVRVVVAHCASLGDDVDLDRGPHGPRVPSFRLFVRLMDDPRYAGSIFADISALTQLNRVDAVKPVLERTDWHARLLNGSDYPLPGVMPLFSVGHLVDLKLLNPKTAPILKAIREHNPLLFDFVVKRHLASNGSRFARSVFETRPFFERRRPPPPARRPR